MTASEFLDRIEPGDTADLIDGELCMHSPVSIRHGEVSGFVAALIRVFAQDRALGRVFTDVIAVQLGPRNVYMPDVVFFSTDSTAEFRDTVIVGAPDLVVEVLSPRTAHNDVGRKFTAYEQAGVREYWVLEPDTLAHRFYRHNGEVFVEYGSDSRRIESHVLPGFYVCVEWLDPDNLPKISACLAQMG